MQTICSKKNKYKVSLKNNVPNTVISLDGKNIVLLISVGQSYHEGDKLLATVTRLNYHKINFCQIMLADSLQRHNSSVPNKWESSVILGNEWITRNEKYINLLQCDHAIKRWDDFLNDERYSEEKHKIMSMYTSGILNAPFNQTVDKFILRNKIANKNDCLEYIMEESPIILSLSALDDFDHIIYPKKISNALAAVHEFRIKNAFPNKCAWLHLKFKKRVINDKNK